MSTDTEVATADPAPKVDFDAVVDRYVQLRDLKKEKKEEYDRAVENIDIAMERIENFFIKSLTAQGMESVKTGSGTVYLTSKTSATVADRDKFLEYVRENDEWAMLDVKVNKTAVKEYRDANQDLPPGVGWSEIKAAGVRRA